MSRMPGVYPKRPDVPLPAEESVPVKAPVAATPANKNEAVRTTAVHAAKTEQNEFSFSEIESRGHFDKLMEKPG